MGKVDKSGGNLWTKVQLIKNTCIGGWGRLGDGQEKYKWSLESKIELGGEESREEIMGMKNGND